MPYRLLFYIIPFICRGLSLQAQADRPLSARAYVSANRVWLGQPFQLHIEAVYPKEGNPAIREMDSLPHFEFTGPPVTDTQWRDQSMVLHMVYTCISFDSGRHVIPSFVLSPSLRTDTLSVEVVFSVFDTAQAYHDIRDILPVETPGNKWPWWYYLPLLVPLLGIAYLLKKKRKKPSIAATAVRVDPFGEALRQLQALEEEMPDARTFHTRLANIFRWYIFRQKGVLSLHQGTGDLLRQLEEKNIHPARLPQLKQALQTGDMVKFARYACPEQESRYCLEAVRAYIDGAEKEASLTVSSE